LLGVYLQAEFFDSGFSPMPVSRRLCRKTAAPELSMVPAPLVKQEAHKKKQQRHPASQRKSGLLQAGLALGLVPKVQKPFALFYSDFKAQVSTKVSMPETMKLAAAQWRQLEPDARQAYQKKYIAAVAYQHKCAAAFGFKGRKSTSLGSKATSAEMALTAGLLKRDARPCKNIVNFNGRFRMHNDQSCKLGQGAYGTVCMVEHLPTGKLFAAKIPRDAEAAGSLQKELHAMAALADHPSFLQPVDASSPGSLVSWIVLPLHGISAHEYLTRSGPLSSDVIHPFAHQLLAALSYLCQRGFVHCDVKPRNVLWCSLRRHLCIIDFGICETLPVQDVAQTSTSCPQSYTPQYRAPELWLAPHKRSRLGQLTDFFAAGCTLFEMCTGFRYYQAESLVQLRSEVLASMTRCRLAKAKVACKIPEPWRQIVWALTEPDWRVRTDEVACLKTRFELPCLDGAYP
jgi:hypothetical protein